MIILTPSYILSEPAVPTSYTRIGYENLLADGTITASTTASGGFADALKTDLTYEWWAPTTVPATITVDFGELKDINYYGIAVHSLGSGGNIISGSYSTDGVNYTTITDSEILVLDDSPIMTLFAEVEARWFRLNIHSGSIPHISVLFVGKTLDMIRPVRWLGHTPGRFGRVIDKRISVSEGGQRLGSSVIRQSLAASFDVYNLNQVWVRNTFDNFIKNAINYGYFIAWDPANWPMEVMYGWTDDPIIPQNSQRSTSGLMSVGWKMIADAGWEGGRFPWL